MKDVEFNKYYLNYIQSKIIYRKKFPSVDKIRKKFYSFKGITKEEEELLTEEKDKIEWNISFIEDEEYLKCRVDNDKKVNVLVQNSFSQTYLKSIAYGIKCAKLFYTNDYPLIIIESNNGGGTVQFGMILQQLLQIRTVDKSYFSYRMSNISKNFFKNKRWQSVNISTCENVESYDDFHQITDHYDYNGGNVEHNRSDVFDLLQYYHKNWLKDFREEYFNSTNIKKPTDIILFTDSYSYSTTSQFIKEFQYRGGAIVVGYFGNPKLEGIDLFDGSQSLSAVTDLGDYYLVKDLENLGYHVGGVTYTEFYDGSNKEQKPNEIPIEYTFGKVDERVEIYQSYSDDIYDRFISEGLRIHRKYNEENKCNPENERLLLHDEQCSKIEGDENAHGGYKCSSEGKWDNSACFPYYCDIGYFYARDKEQCIKECSLENTKSYLLYKRDYKEEINVEKDMTYEYFTVEKDKDIYFVFEASDDCIYTYSNIAIINYYEDVIINKDKNSENDIKLKISAVTSTTSYNNLNNDALLDDTFLFNLKSAFIFKPYEDYVLYLKGILDIPNNLIKIAKITNGMTFKDIEERNIKYYNNYDGEIFSIKANESYIIDFNYDDIVLDQINIFLHPNETEENITIEDIYTGYLYLQKDKTYTLNITDNYVNRTIKLSRKTLNSEIIIEKDENENTKLNSKNLYYKIDNYTGEIKIKVNNDDALIEFLYEISSLTEKLDFEKLELNVNSYLSLIQIPKKYTSKRITFEFYPSEDAIYSLFNGYSNENYAYYRYIPFFHEIATYFKLVVNDTYNSLELMEDEYYNVLIELYDGSLKLKINVEDIEEKKKGLPVWAIILIVVGCLIVIIAIVLIIIMIKKRKTTNKDIELKEKIETLTELQD